MQHRSSIAFLVLSLIVSTSVWAKDASSVGIKSDAENSAGVGLGQIYITSTGKVIDLDKLWKYAGRSSGARKPLPKAIASQARKMSGGKVVQKPVSKNAAKSAVSRSVKKPAISKSAAKALVGKPVPKPAVGKPVNSPLVKKPVVPVLTDKNHGSESGGKKPEGSTPVSATDAPAKNDQSVGDPMHGSNSDSSKNQEHKAGENSDNDNHGSGANSASNEKEEHGQSDDVIGNGSYGDASNKKGEKAGPQNGSEDKQESGAETAGNETEHHGQKDGNVTLPEDNDDHGLKDGPMSYLALVSGSEVPNQLPPIYAPIAPIESAEQVSKVPEPETIALIAIGFIGMSLRRSR